MSETKNVVQELQDIKTYLASQAVEATKDGNELAREGFIESQETIDKAVALLKEHEPASPTWEQGKAYCGNCGQKLPRKRADREINYCGYCGRQVKWCG
jgi:hypothetical protein